MSSCKRVRFSTLIAAPAYEDCTFEPVPGGTRLVVDQDVTEASADFMNDVWPRALARLKALCENDNVG